MLQNKVVVYTNISSNNLNSNYISSSVSNTLFDLMRENILIVDQSVNKKPTKTKAKNNIKS